MTGRVLAGRYELGAALGHGGMARVVEGHDRVLARPVAVKLLDGERADASLRERFLREARAAASFSHPNAVAVYDTGQEGEDAFIVMELVQGRTLAEELADAGALPPALAVSIAEAVLDALGAAHRSGLVHRDVKPGNILLPAEGGVKLTDFGIAKSVLDAEAGLTATGQLLGTPQYLSPEQVEGHPATVRSDVYALGVVLYEMLTGRPPFAGDTPLATAMAHRHSLPEPIDHAAHGIDPGLAAVVHRALEKEPERRFADAAEMRAALRSAPATTAIERRPAAGPAQRPGWLTPLLVGVLLVAALAAFAASRGDAPDQAAGPGGEEPPEAGTEAGMEPEPEPEPEPQPQREPEPAPQDLPGLIGFLATDPDVAGEKGAELFDRLVKVSRERGSKQREEAEKAVAKVEEWLDKEQLDPTVGAWALDVLEPLREPPGRRDGGDDDDDD